MFSPGNTQAVTAVFFTATQADCGAQDTPGQIWSDTTWTHTAFGQWLRQQQFVIKQNISEREKKRGLRL